MSTVIPTVTMEWVENFEIPGAAGDVYTFDGERYYRVGMFLYQPENNVLDFAKSPPYKALHAYDNMLIAEPYTGE